MEGAQRTVADAVFVDEQDVAVLVLQLLQQVVVQHVVRVYHHVVVLIRQLLVGVQVALAAAVGDFQDRGDEPQLRELLPNVVAQQVACQDDGVALGGIVPREESADGVAQRVRQVLFLQRQVGEGEEHGYLAGLVCQAGGAYLLCGAQEVLQHAPAVPQAQRGPVHHVERLEPQQQAAVVEERQQLAVVREGTGDIPVRLRPLWVQVW